MKMCMDEVMKAAGQDMAVLVKMNMRDGFKGGMELDETLEVARTPQNECGAHALILSGGRRRAPMYVMRGFHADSYNDALYAFRLATARSQNGRTVHDPV